MFTKDEQKNKRVSYFLVASLFVLFIGVLFQNFNNVDNLQENNLSAQASGYVPLEKIEGFTDSASAENNLGEMLVTIFNWGLAIAVTLSVLMIILGGLQYMTTDSVSGKSEGITKLKSAVVGLLLALSTILILEEINPDITNFENNLFVNPSKTNE